MSDPAPFLELQAVPHFKVSCKDPVGSGSFGCVYKVEDVTNGKLRAVKLIPRDAVTHNTVREVLNHYKLIGHHHIVGFKEVLLTPNFLCIIMEYANKGNLHDHVVKVCKKKVFMGETDVRRLFQQLIVAVDYMHSKGITNRDVKLDNLLLHEELPGQPLLLKVCDFGYSKDETKSLGVTSGVGTPCYMPPEVWNVTKEGFFDGKAVDVWCCGVVLYAMMWGKSPFGSNPQNPTDKDDMVKKMESRSYDMGHQPGYSEGCKSLLRRMLEPVVVDRIKIAQILVDPWFAQDLNDQQVGYNASIPERTRGYTPTQSLQHVIHVLLEAVPADLRHTDNGQRVFSLLVREMSALQQSLS